MTDFNRPRFPTVADYVDHICAAMKTGAQPWEPASRQELEAAVNAFPNQAYRWRPTTEALELAGLPETFGQPVQPFDERWCERFFETLRINDKFARGVALILEGHR